MTQIWCICLMLEPHFCAQFAQLSYFLEHRRLFCITTSSQSCLLYYPTSILLLKNKNKIYNGLPLCICVWLLFFPFGECANITIIFEILLLSLSFFFALPSVHLNILRLFTVLVFPPYIFLAFASPFLTLQVRL